MSPLHGPGGSMQPQGHAQIVINMVDFGMSLQEAGDAARVNHKGSSDPKGAVMSDGGVVHLERGFGQEVRDQLKRLGHTLGASDGSFGGYQAIMFDKERGVYYGASEVRKDGHMEGQRPLDNKGPRPHADLTGTRPREKTRARASPSDDVLSRQCSWQPRPV